MRLRSIIAESKLNKLTSLLRRAGIDLESVATRKLLRFALDRGRDSTSAFEANSMGGVARELNDNRRLATWVNQHNLEKYPELRNFDVVKYGNGLLLFKPENRDVIDLLLSTRITSPVNDILNGLVFGYEPSSTVSWGTDRATGSAIKDWLRQYRVNAGDFKMVDGRLLMKAAPNMVSEYRRRLEDAGVVTYDVSRSAAEGLGEYVDHYFMIDMPRDLKSPNLRKKAKL